ncbi:MAG TPA: TetR/AcrR family transcriptional regulator [Smithellaceae bacterium]|jgi:AcrR family transcriptional regulator|nr:TetR/AcrR family transcriptional regulator [Syntrophaceae bacterium]HPV48686.1 TetR/AcrR family transcriptional regulator [Smithellaceae bacterium]
MADHARPKTRKDRIMDAALRIFAEKSFADATISEISKEAGVSEATIYEYFGTKEDLLFAIPEKISNDTFEESQMVLPYIKDAEGRLRAIMYSYIRLYHGNPDYSALVLLQLMSNKRFRQTAAHAAIRRAAHGLLDCIREGIADGTFRKDVDAYLVRSMLMGTIEHVFIHWHMQGMPNERKTMVDMLDSFLEMVFCGIRARKEQDGVLLRVNLEDVRSLAGLLADSRSDQEHITTNKQHKKTAQKKEKEK